MNQYQTKIKAQTSQIEISKLIQQILLGVSRQISLSQAIKNIPTEMAEQIISVQSQQIHQIRSANPNPPYSIPQQNQPTKMFVDTIRPFSARIQKPAKMKTLSQNKPTNPNTLVNLQANNAVRTAHSFRSVKTLPNKPSKKQPNNQSKKYTSKVVALPYDINQIQSEHIFDKLRKKKQKTERDVKEKQIFIMSIDKQNQQYRKKQIIFANSINRKSYTYNFKGQILEVRSKINNFNKKQPTTNPNIITSPAILQDNSNKPQTISVQFNKKCSPPPPKAKQYILAKIANKMAPQFFSLTNTDSTKYTFL